MKPKVVVYLVRLLAGALILAAACLSFYVNNLVRHGSLDYSTELVPWYAHIVLVAVSARMWIWGASVRKKVVMAGLMSWFISLIVMMLPYAVLVIEHGGWNISDNQYAVEVSPLGVLFVYSVFFAFPCVIVSMLLSAIPVFDRWFADHLKQSADMSERSESAWVRCSVGKFTHWIAACTVRCRATVDRLREKPGFFRQNKAICQLLKLRRTPVPACRHGTKLSADAGAIKPKVVICLVRLLGGVLILADACLILHEKELAHVLSPLLLWCAHIALIAVPVRMCIWGISVKKKAVIAGLMSWLISTVIAILPVVVWILGHPGWSRVHRVYDIMGGHPWWSFLILNVTFVIPCVMVSLLFSVITVFDSRLADLR